MGVWVLLVKVDYLVDWLCLLVLFEVLVEVCKVEVKSVNLKNYVLFGLVECGEG